MLTRYFPQAGKDASAVVEQIRAACEWTLEVDAALRPVPEPAPEELFRIRLYDQRREFLTSSR